jgi:hypothetical protein
MATITFDSKNVKSASTYFGFGLEASDWDREAEAALMLDAVCDGVMYSPVPTPAPAVESGPTDADRAWWTAETLGSASDGFMVEGERVRRPRRVSAEAVRRAEEDLRWAAYLEAESNYFRRRMEAEDAGEI